MSAANLSATWKTTAAFGGYLGRMLDTRRFVRHTFLDKATASVTSAGVLQAASANLASCLAHAKLRERGLFLWVLFRIARVRLGSRDTTRADTATWHLAWRACFPRGAL